MGIRELIPSKPPHRSHLGTYLSSPIDSLHEQLDQLFSDFFPKGSFGALWPEGGDGQYFPVKLDVADKADAIEVIADLPGMDESNVDVTISEGTLRIKGERETEKEERGKEYYRHERMAGAFNRWIALPCEIDEEKIEAKFKNGILTVTLPKSKTMKEHEHKIEVKSA